MEPDKRKEVLRRVALDFGFFLAVALLAAALPKPALVPPAETAPAAEAASPLTEEQSLAWMRSILASGQAPEEIESLRREYPERKEKLSAAERMQLESMFPILREGGNPIARQMQQLSRSKSGREALGGMLGAALDGASGARPSAAGLKDWAERNAFNAVFALWGIPIALILAMFVGMLIDNRSLSLASGSALFSFSQWGLWLFSALAVAAQSAYGLLLPAALPYELWAGFPAFLLIAAMLLRLSNPGQPPAHRVLGALAAPAVAGALIGVWAPLSGAVRGWLAAFGV